MFRVLCALAVMFALATSAEAGWRGRSQPSCSGGQCSGGSCPAVPDNSRAVPVNSSYVPVAVACSLSSGNACVSDQPLPMPTPTVSDAVQGVSEEATDALAEVNSQRAQRGLPPYQHDPGLTAGAKAVATYRARYRIRGHVTGGMGDFQFLPAGTSASTAGCAAWPQGMGFGACAMFDRFRFAGAASVRGSDGLMYHHLFCR